MTSCVRVLLGFVLVSALGHTRLPADEPPTPPAVPPPPGAAAQALSVEEAAEAVRAAWMTRDGVALTALAGKDDPDPWLVADALVAGRKHEAAVAFAEARVAALSPASLPDGRYAHARHSLALLLRHLGARLRAREEFEQAAEAYPAEESLGAAEAWILAAALDQALGSPRHGLLLLERAQARLRGTGHHDGLGRAHRMEGLVQRDLGAFPRALRAFEAARSEYVAAGDRPNATLALQDLGDIHVVLGNLAEAERAYVAARGESLLRLDTNEAARAHGKLALIKMLKADLEGARRMLEPGLGMLNAVGTAAQREVVLCILAAIHVQRGDLNMALLFAQRAAATAAQSNQRASPFATALLGAVHARLGHFEEALALLDEARGRSAGVQVTFGIVALRGIDAATRLMAGDHAGASLAAREAVAQVPSMVEGLAEENSAIARQIWFDLYAVGMWAAAGLGDVGETYFFLETGRAGGLLESLGGRRALLSRTVPEPLQAAEAEAREHLRVADDALQQAVRARTFTTIRGLATTRDAAWLTWEKAVARIQGEASLSADLLSLAPAQLSEIQEALGVSEALVLYGLGKEGTRTLLGLDGAQGVALVVTPEGARLVLLGAAAAIEAACGACDLRATRVDPAEPLERLRKLIVDPLALGPRVERVLVSPDGALHGVAFSALLADKEVAFSPSATVHLRLRAEAGGRGQGILAFGNPGSDLPGSEEEAKAIGDVQLLGDRATEAGFHAAIAERPRWHAVHLASHGHVDPDRPMRSNVALGRVGEDDGKLTALEVFQIRVPADLVVLSACETGRGKVYRGEGLVGLMRAFMSAGSPRVLCSLWKVDDEATRALMLKFYELWDPKLPLGERSVPKGLGAAAALKAAQAHVRSFETWKHPYYWAAWVLWGLPD